MAEVAVLGTGRMGAAIARRIAAGGHAVTVWNRTEANARRVADSLPGAGIQVAVDAAQAVSGRDVVISMLADGAATRAVLLHADVLPRLSPGAVVCDMATSGVDVARQLSAAIEERGVLFLDAPVSGSVPAVETGTLLVMAAGRAAAVEAAREVLGTVADRVVVVGEAGAGQAMKLAVNLVVHDLNAALAESLVLAERAGISRTKAYDVLEQSVVAAPFVRYKRQSFLDRTAPVAMSLALVAKDLRLITQFAEETAAPVEVTMAALCAVDKACAAGLGPSDMAELSRYLRRREDQD